MGDRSGDSPDILPQIRGTRTATGVLLADAPIWTLDSPAVSASDGVSELYSASLHIP
jgi:hypothetical protein